MNTRSNASYITIVGANILNLVGFVISFVGSGFGIAKKSSAKIVLKLCKSRLIKMLLYHSFFSSFFELKKKIGKFFCKASLSSLDIVS